MPGTFFSDPLNSIATSAQPAGQASTYGGLYDPTMWAAKAIIAREPNKILARMAVDYSDDVKGYGQAINIQTIVNLVANAKADQTQVTLQQPVGSNVSLTLNRYYEASFLIERSLAQQARLNLQEEYVPKAVEIIERKKDNDIAALYSSAANQAAGTSGTTAITDAAVINGVQLLDTANVPAENRHMVFAPSARADLLAISKYIGLVVGSGSVPAVAMTNNVVEKGYFGELYGIHTNFTTNLVNASGWQNMMFHESAFGLATDIETTVDQDWIPQYKGWLSSASGLWGRVCIRPDHVVNMPSH